jgi:2-haloacid dehalogenase
MRGTEIAMTLRGTSRPGWLTFDCYGTLIQWDEGLIAVVSRIFERHRKKSLNPHTLIQIYDRIEHEREQQRPFRRFDDIVGASLAAAMKQLQLECTVEDVRELIDAIPKMIPFPEVPETLLALKGAGFRLCIISNTADHLISGNVSQLGESVMDRVITAQQAEAYKPDRRLFEHAWRQLGVDKASTCHICASPQLDHTAARDLKFRCIWIDRGTGRQLLHDYAPDAILPKLDKLLDTFREFAWM